MSGLPGAGLEFVVFSSYLHRSAVLQIGRSLVRSQLVSLDFSFT